MKFEPIGDGDCVFFIAYGFRTDYMAIKDHVKKFLTMPLAAQYLEDAKMGKCARGHYHTCALSIVGNNTFGDVVAVVRPYSSYSCRD